MKTRPSYFLGTIGVERAVCSSIAALALPFIVAAIVAHCLGHYCNVNSKVPQRRDHLTQHDAKLVFAVIVIVLKPRFVDIVPKFFQLPADFAQRA